MTEQEAREILAAYREIDDNTGEDYGYIIQNCIGMKDDSFFFECKVEGVKYHNGDQLPVIAVFPDKSVFVLPV